MVSVDVEKLLAAVGIHDAEKRGRELWACCPIPGHDEKTPSFSILDWPGTEHHGGWRCYGCHEGGGPIGLLRKVLGYGSREARAALANLDRGDPTPALLSVGLSVLARRQLQLPAGVKVAPLPEWPTPFRRYLERRDRGITARQVERWGIGYAADGTLAMRIVIPIRDERGALLSYTARSIVDEDPKYLGAAKREGRRLGAAFGRQYWPPLEGRHRLFITEGAIDALACERAGAPAVMALDGSNIDPALVDLMRTFDDLIVVTDQDTAGNTAVAFFESQRQLAFRRLLIPGGADAAATDPEVLRGALARFR